MSYRRFEPVDPREAFTVRPRAGVEHEQSVAASQAAYLLAVRAAILGGHLPVEKSRKFPLPELGRLRRRRHFRVEEACQRLGASEKELRQEKEAALERELTVLARELFEKPWVRVRPRACARRFARPSNVVPAAGMRSSHASRWLQ